MYAKRSSVAFLIFLFHATAIVFSLVAAATQIAFAAEPDTRADFLKIVDCHACHWIRR